MVRFPPKKSHDTFCPPISRFPKKAAICDCDSWCSQVYPLTLQPLLIWNKTRETPTKNKGSSLRLKSLEKETNTRKNKENRKTTKKNKEIEKSKDWKVSAQSHKKMRHLMHSAPTPSPSALESSAERIHIPSTASQTPLVPCHSVQRISLVG